MVTFDRGGIWAAKWYKNVPKTDWHRVGVVRPSDSKETQMTLDALRMKHMPAPNQYINCMNWEKESVNNRDNLQRFGTAKRVTTTDQILETRKLREPGPSSYKVKDLHHTVYLPMSKNKPQTVMLEEARFRGMSTPGHKYDPNPMAYRPKSACARVASRARVTGTTFKDTRMKGVAKDKTRPDMCTYDTTESFDKTKRHKRIFSFRKEKKTTFLDEIYKVKKTTPGIW